MARTKVISGAKSSAKSGAKSIKKARRGSSFTIGIDLGGTKVAAALVDSSGKILKEVKLPTVPPELQALDPRKIASKPTASQVNQHVKYVISAMAESAATVLDGIPKNGVLQGVGLASAGPMDLIKGTLDQPSNFTGWKTVPIVKLLSEALAKNKIKKPVFFQNDAMAAALGEGWVGQAKGCSTFAMITVGTGIGSGVVFEGRPAQSRGMGSEWGHLMANIQNLSRSRHSYYEKTIEGLASGTGLILRAKSRGFEGETASDLAKAAGEGDALAKQVFLEGSEALASLFYALSIGFHPEKFLISGGMLAIREHYLPQAVEIYRDMMKQDYPKFIAPIQIAKLGTKAGLIGAARLPHLS